MIKEEVASFSLMKIICISLIMIFCSTIGVMAFNVQIDDAIKMVPIRYEDIINGEVEKNSTQNTATMEDILNSYENIIEKIETIVEEVPFETITKGVSGGTSKVVQAGENGEKTTVYKVKYIGEEEISREEVSSEITKKPVDKIIEVKKTSSRGATTRIETTATENSGEYVKFTATGYCACVKCCGKTNGITASGAKAQAGTTVAMSSKYSFGTKVEIKGMGTYVVQDRGGAIQGNKIDIFFATHQEALNFGRRTIEVNVY